MASLTKYIPYPAVTHAGGEYLLAHYRALTDIAEVRAFAPNTPENRQALPKATGEPPVEVLPGPRLRGLRFRAQQLESVWAGSSIYGPVRRLFTSDRAPWRELAQADLIELQWSEMIALAPSIRGRLPGATIVGVAHDVITQRWERQAAGGGSPLRRLLARVAGHRARRREARSFAALDVLIVFSEKDAVLARELAPSVQIDVVHPGLGPEQPLAREVNQAAPMVLFTGAMNRPENSGAVTWLLDSIWPFVAEQVPEAHLVIAGARPPAALAAQVATAPRTRLTGFVDSLEPFYASASVFVVPLRTGAGVKFKTLDALLRGAPIVTTTVGAEGIDGPNLFAAVTDDAAAFAAAVVRELRTPDGARAEAARAWADGVYGVTAFRQRIRELYGDLLPR